VRRFPALVLALAALPAQAALDAEGVAIGASEGDVRKQYPSAYCRPLEWPSHAADRRCDDGRARFAGVNVRITFYLKKNAVEAFDVRFVARDGERLAASVLERYGKPETEVREPKRIRLEWRQGAVRAVLDAPLDKRQGSLLVARGDFEEEIYKVR
jgi:hypothetical protein